MNLFKTLKLLKKLQKHMRRNEDLKKHIGQWLEETFKIKDEQEFYDFLNHNPGELIKIVEHYDRIKGEYG